MSNGSVDLAHYRKELIQSLRRQRILKSPEIEEALSAIKREDFLWPGTPSFEAYFDEPVALGNTGQTISAPHMVTIMLEELELKPGMTVLEVGCGSGYNAALLGYLMSRNLSSKSGFLVISIERNRELVKFAKENIRKARLNELVSIVEGDGSLGYPSRSEDQRYDRIVVTAAAPSIPHFLEKQLKANGILEIPVGHLGLQSLLKLRKKQSDDKEYRMQREEITGAIFVPLIGEDAYHS